MLPCPRCESALTRTFAPAGCLWLCPHCGGRAANLAMAKRIASPQSIKTLWQKTLASPSTSGCRCPSCRQPMTEIPVPINGRDVWLDACRRCQFIWFDSGEIDAPPGPAYHNRAPQPKKLPQAAREAIALHEVKKLAEAAEHDESTPDPGTWEFWVALLGLPVEKNATTSSGVPVITWALAALISVISLAAFTDLESVVQQFGFIPAEAWRLGGLTSFTSFFLHADGWHLVGNLYFLLIFGDNVEEILGRWKHLALIFVATIIGDLSHALVAPDSTVPAIGASGGISGVIVYYALQFPRARIGILLRFHWVVIPAWVAVILWILLQVFGAYQQAAGMTDVSAMAHLGGALTGFAFWLAQRR